MKYLIILFLIFPFFAHATVFNDVNLVRKQNGLKPLKYDRRLAMAAMNRGIGFLEGAKFAHTGYESFITATGYGKYGGCDVGENLAVSISSDDVVAWWYYSPSHRNNMLSEKFTHSGTAIIHGVNGIYIVQTFGNCKL